MAGAAVEAAAAPSAADGPQARLALAAPAPLSPLLALLLLPGGRVASPLAPQGY